jgi:protein TonB
MLPPIVNPIQLEPPAPVEEPRPVVQQTPQTTSHSEIYEGRVLAPRQIPTGILTLSRGEDIGPVTAVTLDPTGIGLGNPDNPFNGHGTGTVVRQAQQATQHLSTGVMEGRLLYRVLPIYPPIARAMRLSGRVELEATISRTGTIENLRAAAGPPILQQAAIDAVKHWRYRPYLLNGEPVEVETTVNVDFTLN